MTFDPRDLLLIPFPFTDQTASKRRPVLVLTPADRYGDFTGLPVTSRPQAGEALPLSPADLTSGALPLASWIRTDRIVTLNSSIVVKSVGEVAPGVLAAALANACSHLGCSTGR